MCGQSPGVSLSHANAGVYDAAAGLCVPLGGVRLWSVLFSEVRLSNIAVHTDRHTDTHTHPNTYVHTHIHLTLGVIRFLFHTAYNKKLSQRVPGTDFEKQG